MPKKGGLPGNPGAGVPDERVIWVGTTWPRGLLSWCLCSQNHWKITNRRIDLSSGCCGSKMDTLDVRRVTDVKYHRTCSQFMLCRGTLVIDSADETTPKIEIPTWGMRRVYEEFRQAVLSARQLTAVDPAGDYHVAT
eukprot:Unigene1001_Nuclearia_a/m.3199 Unigene1001_Nuclearia_a/g.3199  ORF Unigene1001_Nuclearia_a/g.3199 Unigene1001_Nuclearia_a/m.3199 type:complete len:137 (+) Unigene1001_Nuclearia_a:34-444(+)